MTWAKLFFQLSVRSLRDPALGVALLRVGWRFRHRDWLKKAPFLPLPDKDYLRWRMYTAYGDSDIVPPAEDIINYARWAVKD